MSFPFAQVAVFYRLTSHSSRGQHSDSTVVSRIAILQIVVAAEVICTVNESFKNVLSLNAIKSFFFVFRSASHYPINPRTDGGGRISAPPEVFHE